jgi:hypothetical protein
MIKARAAPSMIKARERTMYEQGERPGPPMSKGVSGPAMIKALGRELFRNRGPASASGS